MSQDVMEVEDSQGKRKFRVVKLEGVSPSSSAKRRKGMPKERLVNVAPSVAKKRRVGKRGSSVRVTIRNQLKARRKQLRRNFYAMKKQYLIKKRKIDRDINSLICKRAGLYKKEDI